MRLRPIGRLRTPFPTLADCPRNGRQIKPAPDCFAEVDEPFHPGLAGVETFSHLLLLYWLGSQENAQEDVLTIRPPFHAGERGVFATRAPVRPNPVGLSLVSLHAIDGGRLLVRNLDCLDGTPLLDIKPYLPSTDAQPDASMGWLSPYRTERAP